MKDLINKLERMNKGANSHTINKATMYLQKAIDKGYESKLEPKVRVALLKSDWSEVKKHMITWW